MAECAVTRRWGSGGGRGKCIMTETALYRAFRTYSPTETHTDMRITRGAIRQIQAAVEAEGARYFRAAGEVAHANGHIEVTPNDWRMTLRALAAFRLNGEARVWAPVPGAGKRRRQRVKKNKKTKNRKAAVAAPVAGPPAAEDAPEAVF